MAARELQHVEEFLRQAHLRESLGLQPAAAGRGHKLD